MFLHGRFVCAMRLPGERGSPFRGRIGLLLVVVVVCVAILLLAGLDAAAVGSLLLAVATFTTMIAEPAVRGRGSGDPARRSLRTRRRLQRRQSLQLLRGLR